MRNSYFSRHPDDPEPLHATVSRHVRFEEVDPLGIVWHGRYPSFFDDARVAVGNRYGMGYMDFLDHGVVTPIRQLHLDHIQPLSYPEVFTVEAALCWSGAARINYEFTIRGGDGRIAATGYTVQLMLDRSGEVLMVPPPFLTEIRERWRAGELEPVTDPESPRTRLIDRFTGSDRG